MHRFKGESQQQDVIDLRGFCRSTEAGGCKSRGSESVVETAWGRLLSYRNLLFKDHVFSLTHSRRSNREGKRRNMNYEIHAKAGCKVTRSFHSHEEEPVRKTFWNHSRNAACRKKQSGSVLTCSIESGWSMSRRSQQPITSGRG
jgi:hypothetical protein